MDQLIASVARNDSLIVNNRYFLHQPKWFNGQFTSQLTPKIRDGSYFIIIVKKKAIAGGYKCNYLNNL